MPRATASADAQLQKTQTVTFFTTLVPAHMIVTLSDDSCMFVVEGPVPHDPANVVHASCTGCAAPAKSSLKHF